MEWSELTALRLKQIISGWRTVVQWISKQMDSFGLVLGLGWDYLATEGIISLARLSSKARKSNEMVLSRPDLGYYIFRLV
jgi:hypothetical protein